MSSVVEGYVFVELSLSNHDLSLERIDPADCEGQVREGYGIRTVSGILAVQCVYTQGERRSGPGFSI